jgi:iron complex outermembrane receptor protein
MPNLLLRASVGNGFAAPSLDIITQKPSYSADSVYDAATALAIGIPADKAASTPIQVDTYYIANSKLSSEKSKNYNLGLVFDATDRISVKADYWSIDISDKIGQLDAATILDREQGFDPRAIPAGLGVNRDPVSGAIIDITAGYANEGTVEARGLDITLDANHKLSGIPIIHRLTFSRSLSYKDDGDELVGIAKFPRTRWVYSTTVKPVAKWEMNLAVNHIGENGTGSSRMPGVRTVDIQVSTESILKGGKLTLGVLNLNGWYPGVDGGTRVPDGVRAFNSYLYDAYGRQPYIRYTHSF